MDRLNRLEIESACRSLSHAFAHHLDRKDYLQLADLFAESGVWIRHGERLTGRSRIIDAMNKRPKNQFTRHLTANVFFTEVGPEHSRGVVSNISYFAFDVDVLPAPFVPENTMLIEFQDTYTNTAEGWKILERDTRPLLIPDSMRAAMQPHS